MGGKELSSHPFTFCKYPEKDMLCTYVIDSHLSGFPHGKIYHKFCPWAGGKIHRFRSGFSCSDKALYLCFEHFMMQPVICKDLSNYSISIIQKS